MALARAGSRKVEERSRCPSGEFLYEPLLPAPWHSKLQCTRLAQPPQVHAREPCLHVHARTLQNACAPTDTERCVRCRAKFDKKED